MDTVLITGTTSGIGKALAETFARAGNHLILVSRNTETLQRQQMDLQARYHSTVKYIACDLTDPQAADRILAQVSCWGLSVDILVNNAGFNAAGYFAGTQLTKELDMIQVHVQLLTSLTKLCLPGMIARGYGRILNIGSTGSYMPCPCDAVYAATKAYVRSFSNGLSQELKGTGVTVTCLCPGATQTLFAEKAGLHTAPLFKHFVMQPERVAAIGYKKLQAGRREAVAGLYNQLLVLSAKLLPTALLNPIAQRMVTPQPKKIARQLTPPPR